MIVFSTHPLGKVQFLGVIGVALVDGPQFGQFFRRQFPLVGIAAVRTGQTHVLENVQRLLYSVRLDKAVDPRSNRVVGSVVQGGTLVFPRLPRALPAPPRIVDSKAVRLPTAEIVVDAQSGFPVIVPRRTANGLDGSMQAHKVGSVLNVHPRHVQNNLSQGILDKVVAWRVLAIPQRVHAGHQVVQW